MSEPARYDATNIKVLVLAFSLACTGATLDAGAASLDTTPQPPSVPTAGAGGQNPPAAQAREDPKDAVEAIKTIAKAAIESAGADVETVKWIFTAMAGLAALLGVVGSVLGFLGFKTFKKSRELVQKKAEEESENLSALRSSIGLMMTFQNFIMVNHPILTSLAKDIPCDAAFGQKLLREKVPS